MKTLLLISCVLGFLGVAFGAFGAHALKEKLSPQMLEAYKTGVQYQFYHVFALLAVALLAHLFPQVSGFRLAGWLIVGGILLFSGSLYVMALTGISKLGIITPFGGLLFLSGWVVLGWSVWKGLITE